MTGLLEHSCFIVIGIFVILKVSFAQNNIFTIPPTTTSALATNYVNLSVIAEFSKTANAACEWKYNGRSTSPFLFYEPATTCESVFNPPKDLISCTKDGIQIESTLTLLQPLNKGSLNVSVVCDDRILLEAPIITVQDCPSIISSDITVNATSYRYNAQGTFKCSSNGELFYSNGTQPSSSDTTCLASATWSGQNNLQCWSAPTNVTLGGDLTVVEGNNLTLTCDYVDTIPSGSSSIFYVANVPYTRPKNEPLLLSSLNRNDNDKIVSCQAATLFTQMSEYNNTGRSSDRTINVQYAPFQDMQPPPCIWAVNQTGSCQVEFLSNPRSIFTSLTLNETSVINDGSNEIISSHYLQTYYYNRTKVTSADNGRYVLTVQTSVFPNNILIYFDVIVVDHLPTTATTSNNLSLIIGISCAASGIFILILLVIMNMRKWKVQKSKDDSQSSPLYRDGNGTLVDVNTSPSRGGSIAHVNSSFDGDTDKREVEVNSLYGFSMSRGHVDSTYAEMDNNRNNKGYSENEERDKPLCNSSTRPEQIEVAYGEVDEKKLEKKKGYSENEERYKPLYYSSTRPKQIEVVCGEVDEKKHEKKKEQPEQIDAIYAEIDKRQKKKQNGKSEKGEKTNQLYAASDQTELFGGLKWIGADAEVRGCKRNKRSYIRKSETLV